MPVSPMTACGGGSGIVPLMAMLRHRAAIGANNPTALLFSVQTAAEAIYRQELEQLAQEQVEPLDLHFIHSAAAA